MRSVWVWHGLLEKRICETFVKEIADSQAAEGTNTPVLAQRGHYHSGSLLKWDITSCLNRVTTQQPPHFPIGSRRSSHGTSCSTAGLKNKSVGNASFHIAQVELLDTFLFSLSGNAPVPLAAAW